MIEYTQTKNLIDTFLANNLLISLEQHYPNFQNWYINTCMPGIIIGDDIMIVAKEHHKIIGVAIGKNNNNEKKLRCVRVHPEYQNKGVGLHLIDRMLLSLNCDKPHCTVSEELIHQYSRAFINKYNFDLTHVSKGLYRPQKLEYIFNSPNIYPESIL